MILRPNDSGLIVNLVDNTVSLDLSHGRGQGKLFLLLRHMLRNGEAETANTIRELLSHRDAILRVSDEIQETINQEIDTMRETDPHLFNADGSLNLDSLTDGETYH